jgi:hypothetical protein
MHSRTYSEWPACPCGIPNSEAFRSHSSNDFIIVSDGAGFFFAAEAGTLTATARTPAIAMAQMRMLISSH